MANATQTRTKHVSKVYYGPEDDNSARTERKPWRAYRVEYVSDGETIDISLADFNDDMRDGAALYGTAT